MRIKTKETIALAFIVGLQHLPPQQRAVLVLRDVLGYRAEEVADILQTSKTSVNSLLRRARAAFVPPYQPSDASARRSRTPSASATIIGRFAETVENGDIDGMIALLTDDAWLTMPPAPARVSGT